MYLVTELLSTWVLSPTAQIHPNRSWIEPSNSQFVWLNTPGVIGQLAKAWPLLFSTHLMIAVPCRIYIQQQKYSSPTAPFHVSLPWLAVWWELPTRKWFITVDTLVFCPCLENLGFARLRQSSVHLPCLELMRAVSSTNNTFIPVWCIQAHHHFCCYWWHQWEAQGTWD